MVSGLGSGDRDRAVAPCTLCVSMSECVRVCPRGHEGLAQCCCSARRRAPAVKCSLSLWGLLLGMN